jgi:hypothetical protein
MPLTGRLLMLAMMAVEHHPLMELGDGSAAGPREETRHDRMDETGKAGQKHLSAEAGSHLQMLDIGFANGGRVFQKKPMDHDVFSLSNATNLAGLLRLYLWVRLIFSQTFHKIRYIMRNYLIK